MAMKQMYRVVQTNEDTFVVQGRFLFIFWVNMDWFYSKQGAILEAKRLQSSFKFKKKIVWP